MGTMQPIHETQDAKVHVALLVVDIVALHARETWEGVSAMRDRGIQHGDTRENEQRHEVNTLQRHWHVDRHGVLERVVDGVRVNGSQRNRRAELVVNAMEPLVHELCVHEPVHIVEDEVANDNSDGAVDEDFANAREIGIHAEDREFEIK